MAKTKQPVTRKQPWERVYLTSKILNQQSQRLTARGLAAGYARSEHCELESFDDYLKRMLRES
jgi:hypothetical protein